MIRITFLGVGGWVSHPLLGHSSVLIEFDKFKVLTDAGEGTYSALRTCTSYDVNDLNLIVITHRHGDHLMGLTTLAQFAKLRKVKLKVISIEDVYEAIQQLFKATGMIKHIELIEFMEVKPSSEVRLGNISIKFIKSKHVVPSTSIRFDYKGKCIVISGDTALNDELIEIAKNCDVLIHEISANDEEIEEAHLNGHSTASEAISIAQKAHVKLFIPYHFPEIPIKLRNIPGVTTIIPYKCMRITL